MGEPQTLVPLQTISLLIIHSRIFKQIFFKAFLLNFSPLQRMFPKLYGSNSIFDVLMTSVYLYCILYYKAAVFNNVLLYLPVCFECLFLCCGEQIPTFSKGAEKLALGLQKLIIVSNSEAAMKTEVAAIR